MSQNPLTYSIESGTYWMGIMIFQIKKSDSHISMSFNTIGGIPSATTKDGDDDSEGILFYHARRQSRNNGG